MKGTVTHTAQIHKDLKIYEDYGKDPAQMVGGEHPHGTQIFGVIPRQFLKVAIENAYKKIHHRHFWWISLNLAKAGHLTRLVDVEDLAATLQVGVGRLMRSWGQLHKDEQFLIKKPTAVQGYAAGQHGDPCCCGTPEEETEESQALQSRIQ